MNKALKVVNGLIIIWGIHLIQGKQADENAVLCTECAKKNHKKKSNLNHMGLTVHHVT